MKQANIKYRKPLVKKKTLQKLEKNTTNVHQEKGKKMSSESIKLKKGVSDRSQQVGAAGRFQLQKYGISFIFLTGQ